MTLLNLSECHGDVSKFLWSTLAILVKLTEFTMVAGCGHGEWYFSSCFPDGDDAESGW